MQMRPYSRNKIEEFLRDFLDNWAIGNEEKIKEQFALNIQLKSNVHGEIQGIADVSKRLREDTTGLTFSLGSSNYFIGGVPDDSEGKVIVSLYLYGLARNQNNDILTFGASGIIEIVMGDTDQMKISEFTFSVNWSEGNKFLPAHWTAIRGQRFWQSGDPTAVIVSELHAPWNKYHNMVPIGREEDLVMETYSKYSWAIDQNDIALLKTVFTEEAEGNLTPMGDLKGLHNIIGQLKEFRQPWPWMQHFGEPIRIKINEDGKSAYLIIGRIVPQYISSVKEEKSYVAFYPLTLIKKEGKWKIDKFHYIPHYFRKFSDLNIFSQRFTELSEQ